MTDLIPIPRDGDNAILILSCGHSTAVLAAYGQMFSVIRGKVYLHGLPVPVICWTCAEISLVTDVITWKL